MLDAPSELPAHQHLQLGQPLRLVGAGPFMGELELQQGPDGVHHVEEARIACSEGRLGCAQGLPALRQERVAVEVDLSLCVPEPVEHHLDGRGQSVLALRPGLHGGPLARLGLAHAGLELPAPDGQVDRDHCDDGILAAVRRGHDGRAGVDVVHAYGDVGVEVLAGQPNGVFLSCDLVLELLQFRADCKQPLQDLLVRGVQFLPVDVAGPGQFGSRGAVQRGVQARHYGLPQVDERAQTVVELAQLHLGPYEVGVPGCISPVARPEHLLQVLQEVPLLPDDRDCPAQVVVLAVGVIDAVEEAKFLSLVAHPLRLGGFPGAVAPQLQLPEPGECLRQPYPALLRPDAGLNLADEVTVGEARVGQGPDLRRSFQGGLPSAERRLEPRVVERGVGKVVFQRGALRQRSDLHVLGRSAEAGTAHLCRP